MRRLVPGPSGEAGGGALVAWMARLCAAAADDLPATGVAVAVMTQAGVLSVAAASDPGAQELGGLQFDLGEGPCIEAVANRRPVLEPDLAGMAASRWPGYAPSALARGIRAVFSFPLQIGAAQLGAMDVYQRRSGALPAPCVERALAFADVALEGLLDAQAAAARTGAVTGLDDALETNYVVYQAQGMTMIDLGTSLADALARLRAHAFAEDRLLADVAKDVVEGRLRLEPDPDGSAAP